MAAGRPQTGAVCWVSERLRDPTPAGARSPTPNSLTLHCCPPCASNCEPQTHAEAGWPTRGVGNPREDAWRPFPILAWGLSIGRVGTQFPKACFVGFMQPSVWWPHLQEHNCAPHRRPHTPGVSGVSKQVHTAVQHGLHNRMTWRTPLGSALSVR